MHLECSLAVAERIASNMAYRFWFHCSDCMQEYIGVTHMVLVQTLAAKEHLANSLCHQAKHAEAADDRKPLQVWHNMHHTIEKRRNATAPKHERQAEDTEASRKRSRV